MSGSILAVYEDRLALGEIEPDAAQRAMVERLTELEVALAGWRRPKSGLLARFRQPPSQTPKGLYIHGAVGRGKSMLMDLFFETAPVSRRRRAHFHEFMSDVHDRIAVARATVPGDPIPVVARAIAAEAELLCFDELQVTDIADAMILGRLFAVLFDAGVVVVATSNSEPGALYRNGLNRQLFLPFIDLIAAHMDVVALTSAKDFRLEKLTGEQLYFTPVDEAARAALDRHWQRLTGHHPPRPMQLEVKGRTVHVPQASMGVARFAFDALCGQPLGANDYLAIAHAFHTVIIDGIPALDHEHRDMARRFITLIDTLYDNRVGLIASAESEPHHLYPAGDGADLFQRTASRLMEMRSEGYLTGRERVRASG